ncbi:MAG TPA: dihydrofolate reductase family protein [Candidatus Paceibacterota bacterium]|jgi:dihydrofolate reductase|nr:dihydrofolate reductase family protein [Candidatus Paceibacterota bacterium]
MRKIITTTFVTLDGVMQAPGGPEEDKTDGFAYGGWQTSHPSDEMMNSTLAGFMGIPFELLLGKTTYDIFAAYWPNAKTDLEVADPFNRTKKYVVSHESFEPSWRNSFCITGDVVTQIKKLKAQDGPDLWVWGSENLIQTLLKHHLIDRMHLWIYPITIGKGKRLFAEGTQAEGFKLVDSKTSTTGVIIATYEPADDSKTALVAKK